MSRSGIVVVLAAWLCASPAVAAGLDPVGPPYAVAPGLKGKDGKKARDVSGIACLPGSATPRLCLVVNDENSGAQFVSIADRTITPGADIDIVGKAPSAKTLGTPPSRNGCSGGEGGFEELDGEGVAYAAPYFYVAGSHGCSRSKAKFKLSSFVLARIRVDVEGHPAGPEAVETTYRLGDALSTAEAVSAYFARDLGSDADASSSNGLNIEGIAVVGGRLFAGLRAPSRDGKTFLVVTDVDALFAPGHALLAVAPKVIPLVIGEGAGIRDLTVLKDGRLLILTGPAQGQSDVPYSLFAMEPREGGTLQALGALSGLVGADKGGKAEAVALLGGGRVLVMFDSIKDGGPREYQLPVE